MNNKTLTTEIPSCDCNLQKLYAFKTQWADYVFCKQCIEDNCIPNKRLCFFKMVCSERYNYDCCSKTITKNNISYRLHTVTDMCVSSSKPVVCNNCRILKIGKMQVDKKGTINWYKYKNNKLCNHNDKFGLQCLKDATKTTSQRCSEHIESIRLAPDCSKEIGLLVASKRRKKRKRMLCVQSNCTLRASFGFASSRLYKYCCDHKVTGIFIRYLLRLP
jgi:hypothetical protein